MSISLTQPGNGKHVQLRLKTVSGSSFTTQYSGGESLYEIRHPSTMVETEFGPSFFPVQRIWLRVPCEASAAASEYRHLGAEDSADIVLREHTDDCYSGAEHPTIRFAWWGADYTRGLDVTDVVHQQLASGCVVVARKTVFGDPAPFSAKSLLLWLHPSEEQPTRETVKDETEETVTEETVKEETAHRRRSGRSRSRYNRLRRAVQIRTPSPRSE